MVKIVKLRATLKSVRTSKMTKKSKFSKPDKNIHVLIILGRDFQNDYIQFYQFFYQLALKAPKKEKKRKIFKNNEK